MSVDSLSCSLIIVVVGVRHDHGGALIVMCCKLPPTATFSPYPLLQTWRVAPPPWTTLSTKTLKILQIIEPQDNPISLQMTITFSLFVCAGLNVLCCLKSTRREDEPEIISPPANTTLEPLERPIMQLAPGSTSATTAQIPSELPSASNLVLVQHS